MILHFECGRLVKMHLAIRMGCPDEPQSDELACGVRITIAIQIVENLA